MKDDYSSVFRNIRTDRMTPRYPRQQTPDIEIWWIPLVGGAVVGLCALLGLLCG